MIAIYSTCILGTGDTIESALADANENFANHPEPIALGGMVLGGDIHSAPMTAAYADEVSHYGGGRAWNVLDSGELDVVEQ